MELVVLDSQICLQNHRIALRFISSSSIVELEVADNVSRLLYPDVTPTSLDADFNISSKSFTRHSSLGFLAVMAGGGLSGGTGQKLTQATIIVAGVASLLASLLSIVLVTSRILISSC
jgi:hypothetical protein